MPMIWRCFVADARAYIRDGAEIYRRSFSIIRAESDLARFSLIEERVAVRIIHACGMTEIARDIVGRFGMSPALGRARLIASDIDQFLGGSNAASTSTPRSAERDQNVAATARPAAVSGPAPSG